MRDAESAVGMEMGRVRDGEVFAAEEMNAQMTSLAETFRTTQYRAEQSALAALEQQRIADKLEAYARRLTALGRSMLNNSEQKHWSIIAELNKVRSDLVRMDTDAE